MTADTLLLLGRETESRRVYETHARRLRERGVASAVRVCTYGSEPARDLRDGLAAVDADRVYAVPVCTAHTNQTLERVPAALSSLDADVQYCEPVGRQPVLGTAILDRAAKRHRPDEDTSLALVGLGNSAGSYARQALERHAEWLRDHSRYAAVRDCYLSQNPAVECVRYSLPTDRAVVVPVFVAPGRATDETIPGKLDLDRGGLAYADPLGTHPAVTDAIEAAVTTQYALAAGESVPTTFEGSLTGTHRPVATDGEG